MGLTHPKLAATHMHSVADHFEAVGDVVHEPVAGAQVGAQGVTQVIVGPQLAQHRHHT